MGINMTEIRYASMADKELLLSRDCHIKEDILGKAILNRYVLVMLAGGNLAGWLRWGLFWDEIPFMNMLYFLEEYRGLGFGTQLVGFWENEMLKLSYDKVMTSSQANETAQHFYRKLGYRDAGGFFPFCKDFEILFTKEI